MPALGAWQKEGSVVDRVEEMRLGVERAETNLAQARKVYDRAQPERREERVVNLMINRLTIAEERLRNAVEVVRREAAANAAEAERLILSAPPSLQRLVVDHGTYDRITDEAWARFDREMATWKAKVRYGEFPAKIHPA
jgi:hypothetical protein